MTQSDIDTIDDAIDDDEFIDEDEYVDNVVRDFATTPRTVPINTPSTFFQGRVFIT